MNFYSRLIFLKLFISYLNLNVLGSDLCNYISHNKYQSLGNQYPEHKSKFDILSQIPLPIWVTDRDVNAFNNVKMALDNCNGLTNTLILYALPNKDCEAGFSSSGSNKNNNDYINAVYDSLFLIIIYTNLLFIYIFYVNRHRL